MKNSWVSKILPHAIAIVVFLVVSLIYCKPALDGKVLNQVDIRGALGASANSEAYAKAHDGQYPLWTNGLFSGMPSYQVWGVADNSMAVYITQALTLGLRKPFQFFFLASICFYILSVTLRINPYVGILGALAFAYATYNPVIVSVGHDTKMLSIAYMPAVLAGVLLIFNKKYWLGGLLTALLVSAMIAMNHVQIVYYLLIVIGILFIYKAIEWIKAKEIKHLVMAVSIALVAGIAGVLANAILLLTTYDYQKYTIRGGSSELYVSKKDAPQTSGLDQSYGLSYSFGIPEPLVLVFPKMYGGSSDKEEVKSDDSKAVAALQSMPAELASQLPMRYYWGGMTQPGEVGTSGPPYIGAVICLLAILSFFIRTNTYRWWIITAVGVSIVLSWGSYFPAVNAFLFDYLPFYNKFRAPSMIMVIPQLLLPLAAILGIQYLITNKELTENKKIFKQTWITGGGLILLGFLLYFSFGYLSTADKDVLQQVRSANQPQLYEYVKSFFDGMVADRKSLFFNNILRTLFFIAAALGTVYLFIRQKIKPVVLIAIIAFLVVVDVFMFNQTYFNKDSFVDNDHFDTEIKPSPADAEILKDKTDYRVFNAAGNSFSENMTSFLYQSIGGYHPAKLRIYQDLIEHQLSKQPMNTSVLNMLNAKYFIAKDAAGVTQQYQRNDSALGSCWLVKQVSFVNTPEEEMQKLDHFNAKDTAYVLNHYKPTVTVAPRYDSTASIQLVKKDNDEIHYSFKGASNQFAVFSEVFYPSGWKAFIDEKEVPIARVNYVLRGLSVPAGEHKIRFSFEPASVATGRSLAKISWVLMLGFAVLFVLTQVRKSKQSGNAPKSA